MMTIEHVEKCKGCGEMIEPDICWCGQSINHGYDNHTAIPMGCSCYRNAVTDADFEPRPSAHHESHDQQSLTTHPLDWVWYS